MTKQLDPKLVVKHIANGTLGENLCRICLLPLGELYENIFTKVCKENEEFCIANILQELCDVKFLENDHYNVCSECFVAASNAFKFYSITRRTEEILNSYTDNLLYNLDSIDMPENLNNESLFFSLPIIPSDIPVIDFDKNKLIANKPIEVFQEVQIKEEKSIKVDVGTKELKKEQEDEEDLVIIMNERGEPSFFKMQANGQLLEYEYDDRCRKAYKVITEELPRRTIKRKREPMTWKKCSRCSVVYRFVAKMKEHMWLTHRVMLNTCKICQALIEGEDEFRFHMNTHTNEYQCDICKIVFKKRETIISHLASHDKMKDTHLNYVCKDCGKILKDEESLNLHIEEHNLKDYTCYYCGRMYKKEIGFNNHIQKHEMYMKLNEIKKKQGDKRASVDKLRCQKQAKEFTCELCGRSFLGQRALLWHSRLHTNERPFTCKVCGRGFVSLNRCNQHSLCAHTAPARRCPLCPALFHMRSMVNSHIKKVHLKTHKRRTRAVRHQDVFWHTEPVPIQELSVAIQSDILELQAARQDAADDVVLFGE